MVLLPTPNLPHPEVRPEGASKDVMAAMQPKTLEGAELIAERADERLDTARLEPYLRERLPGAEGRLSVAQFHGGKANLTYLLRFGGGAEARGVVLRRPPPGAVPP